MCLPLVEKVALFIWFELTISSATSVGSHQSTTEPQTLAPFFIITIIYVIFSAEKIYEDYNNFRAIITSNGIVRWEPGGVFKTMCQIDITYYPFDEQHCDLIFGAWSYHTSKMNLTSEKDIVNLDSYKLNGEWEIMGTVAQRNEFFYECCPNERFSNVRFVIYMRRRHTFYIMNVILPSILTSVLLLSIFFCTPGQKVQIGVVVLLSFRIFLINVSGNIPKTSDHIPLLGKLARYTEYYTSIHTHTHIHTYIHTHTHIHIHICVYMCVWPYPIIR